MAVDQTEAFPYTAQRSRLCWGSQGQDILLGGLGEKEMSGKAQTGEFIKRQSADSKEFFLYWNLFFVGELPLQNTLKHVLGLSKQSCPDFAFALLLLRVCFQRGNTMGFGVPE